MRQQVNLLPADIERYSRRPFSFYFLISSVVLIGLISILLLVVSGQNKLSSDAIALLTKTKTQNQANLEQMRARVATHVASAELQARIAEMRALLASERKLYDALADNQLGNNTGFSALLVDLAQRKPESLWLRQISMESGGQLIDLQGSALDSEAIPIYLQRLGRETSLAGRGVNQIEIAQAKADTTHLDFTIRTELRP